MKHLGRLFPDAGSRPAVVLAVPGYVRVDGVDADSKEPRLSRFEVLWPDDAGERMRWRGWAAESAKRYLAGQIVVGTIDQVLLSALRVNHAHLRATALLRHLLVVDEVHASDAYMNRVLEKVLERHIDAGGHALLMSATLGATARERFLSRGEPPKLADACAIPYPAISTMSGHQGSLVGVPHGGSGKRVKALLAPELEDPITIASRALDAARHGARVLVIRNTVRGAVETQRALEGLATPGDAALLFTAGSVATLHHARFAREDRIPPRPGH
ncbi:MAG: hypothetical protein QM767_09315 [Anaeromyxobacter sp.]